MLRRIYQIPININFHMFKHMGQSINFLLLLVASTLCMYLEWLFFRPGVWPSAWNSLCCSPVLDPLLPRSQYCQWEVQQHSHFCSFIYYVILFIYLSIYLVRLPISPHPTTISLSLSLSFSLSLKTLRIFIHSVLKFHNNMSWYVYFLSECSFSLAVQIL